jgi:hypothetical protein
VDIATLARRARHSVSKVGQIVGPITCTTDAAEFGTPACKTAKVINAAANPISFAGMPREVRDVVPVAGHVNSDVGPIAKPSDQAQDIGAGDHADDTGNALPSCQLFARRKIGETGYWIGSVARHSPARPGRRRDASHRSVSPSVVP